MADPVRIAFLGGLGEIGRNCAVLEQDGRLLLLDCGLMFPEVDMPGVDLVLPDFTFLRENAHRIDACLLTHGHEDHVGALSFLLREVSFPIYGSALTLGLARNRIEAGAVTARTFRGFSLVDALGFTLRRHFIFQNRIAVVLGPSLKGAIPDLAETAALFTGAMRGVERKHTRIEFLESAPTTRAAHFRAHDGQPIF